MYYLSTKKNNNGYKLILCIYFYYIEYYPALYIEVIVDHNSRALIPLFILTNIK